MARGTKVGARGLKPWEILGGDGDGPQNTSSVTLFKARGFLQCTGTFSRRLVPPSCARGSRKGLLGLSSVLLLKVLRAIGVPSSMSLFITVKAFSLERATSTLSSRIRVKSVPLLFLALAYCFKFFRHGRREALRKVPGRFLNKFQAESVVGFRQNILRADRKSVGSDVRLVGSGGRGGHSPCDDQDLHEKFNGVEHLIR